MVASEFPRRLYTKGFEPASDKSIGYYADDYRLVPVLKSALEEDEWEEIYESPLGVFLKFHELDFGWASRLVHHMLTFQIVCKQRYEIWSLIVEEITGLNCGYVDDLALTDLALSDDTRAFWELMGVEAESGPSTIEIIEACSNCSSWSRDDRLWLGYLGIYAGFIVATRPGSSTNVNHARLVMDLKGFKEFPWGRIAFQHLINSVKEKDLSKNIHIEGFVQALQVWVYYALPDFAAEFGEPLPNVTEEPLLLAYKGSRGRKNVKANMLKQARIQSCVAKDLADMFPVWDDDEQDPDIVKIVNALHDPNFKFSKNHWPLEGVLGAHIVKSKAGKRSLPSDESSRKRPCTASASAASFVGDEGVGVVATMKAHFDQCFKSFSTKMLNGLGSCEKQIKLLTEKVESVERAVEELTTGSAKHTEEEPTQQQGTRSKKHEGSNSEKDDAPMKANVNVGACESVNAPGDAKGKKAAVNEEEPPEPSICEIDPKTCDVDFDAVALAKNAKAREAAQLVARATSARHRQLAATQKSPFLGNSTAKTIIPSSASHSGRARGYDPFDQTGVRAKHTTLMNFIKSNPLHSFLIFPNEQHMEAYINLLRLRLSKHPEWFVSDRICFLNSMFATVWRCDYEAFKQSEPNVDGSGKLLPPGAYSYYTGELPIYCQTKKTWAYDVDYLYSMLHIREDHWVAIWVSFVKKHITVWDSHAATKHASDEQIAEAVEPLAVMIPYLLQTCAPEDDKWRFPCTPFTHSRVPGTEIPQNIQSGDCGVYCLKYIECHALDLPFPAELYEETGCKGHDKLDATELDVYDRQA
ncbi:hypothetical protein EUTSA_v10002223mg [Eutrema salsugineum]|uniref:Ubiquitin-like protease family profile domain-containing protein n=1 Tax=Eutrema salsugineum TaxID=72664 RepID=V4M5F8_EUTSA|nr:hypothetical protein EUTSA_v10002223mg [Eutrema salsugineum]